MWMGPLFAWLYEWVNEQFPEDSTFGRLPPFARATLVIVGGLFLTGILGAVVVLLIG
jgi:hypothetical protein